ncbi:PEP-CTERM sorting domain-containing protein [Sedimentisphaera salicampi]|uniref:PEP-CTERM protein-sorting domain-containing protein n=1 Tax=Sedimentisphaera salicampi TaxID=1941349 RepID=A0A1W6LIW3_9BACT|nr:PEP-CTERM sorting domain-containing protein [Sedimentisphaera salicampi]ARN55699.1 hypothetical protein STSP1_00062 [Sedimentisphaera salicampi]
MRTNIIALIFFVITASAYSTLWEIQEDENINNSVYDQINVYNEATLDVEGSQTAVSWMRSYDSSIINLYNGEISTLHQYDSSVLNLHGGNPQGWEMFEQSTAHIYGGDIEFIMINELTNSVNIYGFDFNFVRSGGQQESGWLSGYWQNGQEFEIYLRYLPDVFPEDPYLGTSYITLHEVPEPATVLFFGLAGGVLYNRRKA